MHDVFHPKHCTHQFIIQNEISFLTTSTTWKKKFINLNIIDEKNYCKSIHVIYLLRKSIHVI